MRKRWQVSEDQSTWEDVTPINGAKVTISESRDLDAGQIFFRKKLDTPLKFWKDDYTYFRNFERVEGRRCTPLYIRLQLQCGGWHTFWTGQFSAGSGKWDLTNCIFEVKPETVDRYTCFIEAMKVKRNILQAPKVTANVIVMPSLEFLLCAISGGTPVCPFDDTTGYTAIHSWVPIIDGPTLAVLWREFTYTECINGSPATPPGSGWVLDGDTCDVDGFARWYRTPTISYTWGDPQAFYGGDGYPIPPDSSCEWLEIGSYDFGITPPGDVPFYICLSDGTPEVIDTARTMESAINVLVSGSECGLQGVRSDLFNWQPTGDAHGYVEGEDYVTGQQARRHNLLIVQNTDAMDPDASNPATIADMTIEEMLNIFYGMECFWDIDDDGYLRIEHWTFWTSSEGVDLSDGSLVNEFMSYEYLSNNVPRVERLEFSDALGRDFVGKDIEYAGPCAASNDVVTVQVGKVITDISMILADPSSIQKDGIVILATSFNGTSYDTIMSTGAITGTIVTNAPMSKANIQSDYWMHRRFLRNGKMNGVETTFDGVRPNIKQDDVRFAICCPWINLDPRKSIGTSLGGRLGGIRAEVDEISYDIGSDRASIAALYTY